jgi:hypothetical protein
MHGESTLVILGFDILLAIALLAKQLYFPNMKYLKWLSHYHFILCIFKIEQKTKLSFLITKL